MKSSRATSSSQSAAQGKVVGIGIVTSDCIPPKDSAHPFASDDKHELHYTHARKVDWRITESVRVNFDLGGQTVVRENRWDDIVKAYRAKGIDVYERLWDSGNSSSDTDPSLVRYFKAKGFQFTEEQVVAFYAALKTKGFVILSGLSGTGKTKLAQLFAELLCPCEKCQKGESHVVAKCSKCTHLFLSVRPDWRDSKALLGYYNPLTERYESTPLLEFLLRAAINYEPNSRHSTAFSSAKVKRPQTGRRQRPTLLCHLGRDEPCPCGILLRRLSECAGVGTG